MTNWKLTQDYKLRNGDKVKEWENSQNGKIVQIEQYTHHNAYLAKNPRWAKPHTKKNYRVLMSLFDNCTEEWFDNYKQAAKFASDYKKQNNKADKKYLQSKKEVAEFLKK